MMRRLRPQDALVEQAEQSQRGVDCLGCELGPTEPVREKPREACECVVNQTYLGGVIRDPALVVLQKTHVVLQRQQGSATPPLTRRVPLYTIENIKLQEALR